MFASKSQHQPSTCKSLPLDGSQTQTFMQADTNSSWCWACPCPSMGTFRWLWRLVFGEHVHLFVRDMVLKTDHTCTLIAPVHLSFVSQPKGSWVWLDEKRPGAGNIINIKADLARRLCLHMLAYIAEHQLNVLLAHGCLKLIEML